MPGLRVTDFAEVFNVVFHSVCVVAEKSHGGWTRQKQPVFRQHFLNLRPLPQGQRSLRPSFSSRNFWPWTIRMPRPTWVSDGKPWRRLLIVSKKGLVVAGMADFVDCHGTPPIE